MSKLIKKLENGTDFMVCIHEMNSGKFVVTIYDYVNRTHEKQGAYDDYNEALSVAKSLNDQYKIDENTVKLSESQLRSMIAESVKGILNEIGDTPAGQWMLGRLAGRQRNRELGIDRKSEWSRSSGKIKNTTTDAEKYASDNGYGGSPDSFTAFWKGHNSENYDWYDDTDQYGEYDSRQHAYNEREAGENSAYGDAMASMIRYHTNKALKESVEKAVKSVLKEYLNKK